MLPTGWISSIIGVCLLIYGLVMDTTNDGVHNLGLLSNRISVVIIGGFVLLAGIVLIATGELAVLLKVHSDMVNRDILSRTALPETPPTA